MKLIEYTAEDGFHEDGLIAVRSHILKERQATQ